MSGGLRQMLPQMCRSKRGLATVRFAFLICFLNLVGQVSYFLFS